jgi:hypothetical protein
MIEIVMAGNLFGLQESLGFNRFEPDSVHIVATEAGVSENILIDGYAVALIPTCLEHAAHRFGISERAHNYYFYWTVADETVELIALSRPFYSGDGVLGYRGGEHVFSCRLTPSDNRIFLYFDSVADLREIDEH